MIFGHTFTPLCLGCIPLSDWVFFWKLFCYSEMWAFRQRGTGSLTPYPVLDCWGVAVDSIVMQPGHALNLIHGNLTMASSIFFYLWKKKLPSQCKYKWTCTQWTVLTTCNAQSFPRMLPSPTEVESQEYVENAGRAKSSESYYCQTTNPSQRCAYWNSAPWIGRLSTSSPTHLLRSAHQQSKETNQQAEEIRKNNIRNHQSFSILGLWQMIPIELQWWRASRSQVLLIMHVASSSIASGYTYSLTGHRISDFTISAMRWHVGQRNS